MGQAFRRASGRIRSTSLDPPPSPSSSKKAVDSRPPAASLDKVAADNLGPGSEVEPKNNAENILEDRDPQYDAMLNAMVGRIRSKPGGKPEMGEAAVVEKYKRPLPKLRNTTVDSSRYEERSVPQGTLNVAQLRHIILLHQGKSDDHDGPMDIHKIAEKFGVDVVQIQKILQSMSLPPDNSSKDRNNR